MDGGQRCLACQPQSRTEQNTAAVARALSKAELKLLEPVFHQGHKRFHITSTHLDQLSCEVFLAGAGGARASRFIGLVPCLPPLQHSESYPAVSFLWVVKSDNPNKLLSLRGCVGLLFG